MTMTTSSSSLLIRQELWSNQIKEPLRDELLAMSFLTNISDFMDGETLTIPSVGDALAEDYTENTPVNYQPYDTGEFQFSITDYKSSGTYVTKKNLQDSYYMNTLMSTFPQKQVRAIMQAFETKIWKDPEDVMGTTANGTYTINGLMHRFAAGLSSGDNTIDLADFSYAWTALQTANVPMQNLVAIVPPQVAHKLNTLSNIVNVSNNPNFEGIITTGLSTGFKYVRNIFGFDVFTSNYLPDASTLTNTPTALVHRDGSTAGPSFSTAGTGRPCYFFSAAAGDVNPFIYAFRQMPELDMEYNKDLQRTELITTARYGSKLYRPENMVIAFTTLAMA
jgi:hypothetical protein